jgi:predicted nucleotidyltransferase
MPRFKKSEEELLTHFDKWLYVLKHLHKLQDIPEKLRGKIFEKLFSQAEIAKLNPEEMRTYDESLKV